MEATLPTPTFTIRRAAPADAPVLAKHRCEMWLAMNDLLPEGYAAMYEQCVEYFEEAVRDESYLGWLVAIESGEVVAGGGLLLRRIAPYPMANGLTCPSEKQAHILNMFTEVGYRRYGLANLLMKTLLRWCEEQGVGSVTLNASEAGKPLYEKLGFAEVKNFMKWNGKMP
ncbi:GNAT family N-acetyltransferase [Salmonirosea aquatica]|uniref:GNAT family N-acetyltransferase n=1 Tax=Salmonirosea aquatica TaxID=2654236 RepID=A0A7C9FQB1_9BACT|nr:GNAT family N-acetyltransferase [Cytophagaceae bacterium SJW1-29]